jgi:hypothetical protein
LTLENWLNASFGITGKAGDEVIFPCPECQFQKFYFNLKLKVGHCHRGSCGYSPTLKTLNARSRTKIGTTVFSEVQGYKAPPPPKVQLPEGAKPLVELVDGQYITHYERASSEVLARGVSYENQYRFKFQFDGQRVYIPVYSNGELLNFVGRAAWWKELDIPRYKYATGASTRATIFNWDEMRAKEYIVLVENTFNGIWLMDEFNGTSNFGSDLSREQIDLIHYSDVKRVVVMWDEGAERLASRAVTRLRAKAVQAVALKIVGQPDNYKVDELRPWVEFALQNVRQRNNIIDTGGNHGSN